MKYIQFLFGMFLMVFIACVMGCSDPVSVQTEQKDVIIILPDTYIQADMVFYQDGNLIGTFATEVIGIYLQKSLAEYYFHITLDIDPLAQQSFTYTSRLHIVGYDSTICDDCTVRNRYTDYTTYDCIGEFHDKIQF